MNTNEDDIVFQEIDVASWLKSEINSEKLEFTTALSELIDNSFDAKADHVVINIQPTQLTVWDNGKGTASPAAMCHYANSDKPKGKRKAHVIGRYGVGFKHASFLFSKDIGTTQIVSMHNGVVRRSSVNWGNCILKGKLFAIRDIEVSPDEARAYLKNMCGTFIDFNSCPKPPFGGTLTALDAHIKRLEDRYAPGLRRGRRIELHYKDKPKRILCAPKDPVLQNSIEGEYKVGNKTIFLKAGLLQDPTCGKRGISLTYDFRVISDNCTDIVPPEYPTSGWWARVELDHTWDLSTNKMELKDEDYPLLREVVWNAVQPIAEQAKKSVNEFIINAQLQGLAQRLNEAMGVLGKAKRPNRNGEHRGDPKTNVHRMVREAAVVNGSGEVRRRNAKNSEASMFTMEYAIDPRDQVCWAEGSRVYLNERFEVVRRIKGDPSQMACDLALTLGMYAVTYSELRKTGGQQELWHTAPDRLTKVFESGFSINAAPKAATG